MKHIELIPVNDGTECGEAFGFQHKRYDVFPAVYDSDTDTQNIDFEKCLGSYDDLVKAEALRAALYTSNFYINDIVIYDSEEEVIL